MKKSLVVLVLMAIAVFSAFAADEGLKIGDTTWKFNGEIRFMYTDQTAYDTLKWGNFMDGYADQFNRMYQRYRFGITAELNENLSAHYELQVGDEQWGNKNYNEREMNLRTLYAYLRYSPDFLANTSVTVGLQGYDDIFQTSVFSDEAVGIIANYSGEKFNANIGFLTLRDDDVDQGIVDSSDEGLISSSDTFFLADMNYKLMDGLTIKGAFYYDYWFTNYPLPEMDNTELDYRNAMYGIGADYSVMDTITVGGHFVMRSGRAIYTDPDNNKGTANFSGYFAYGYAEYNKDKFSAKVNFGYTPFNVKVTADSIDINSWSGGFALLGSDSGNFYYSGGDQWVSAYGLEYFGRGEVCDRQSMASSYGDWPGLMVISFNVAYDFMYASYGIMSHTWDKEWSVSETNSIGSELDLGVKTDVMKGLEFRAVYAMFFTGDYFGEDVVNGHEMSMLLRYKF